MHVQSQSGLCIGKESCSGFDTRISAVFVHVSTFQHPNLIDKTDDVSSGGVTYAFSNLY
jgi:hypothetical protein